MIPRFSILLLFSSLIFSTSNHSCYSQILCTVSQNNPLFCSFSLFYQPQPQFIPYTILNPKFPIVSTFNALEKHRFSNFNPSSTCSINFGTKALGFATMFLHSGRSYSQQYVIHRERKVTNFAGTNNPMEFSNWLDSIEEFFDCYED